VNSQTLRPLAAELFGMALFVFVGAGSVGAGMAAAQSGAPNALMIALAHGVGMAIIVSATMNISGGHINPAVTFGLFVAGKVDAGTLGRYWAAQLVGAIVGAALLKAVLPWGAVHATSAGTPLLSSTITFSQGILIEAMLTFVLVSAVFGTAISPEAPKIPGFGIGLAIFVCMVVGGPFTGGVMNPGRAFGPALIAWQWNGQAAYWIGPLIGGGIAGLLWKFILVPRHPAKI